MSSLSEDARDFVLEYFGHAKPKLDEKTSSPLRSTWVVLTLKNGSQIGGKLDYTSVRPGGTDVCMTSVHEVTSAGEWKPTEWKPVEGTQCIIIGAHEYKYIQILDKAPAGVAE